MSDDEHEGLTLSEVADALSDAEREHFARLVGKATIAIEGEDDGVLSRLRLERDAEREQRLELLKDYNKAQASIRVRDERITDLLAVVNASQSEVAAQMLAENERLKKTVTAQRAIIARHEAEHGRLDETPVIPGPTAANGITTF